MSFSSVHLFAIAMSVIALLGLSFGNLYQKRFCTGMNILTGGAIQSAPSTLVLLPFAFALETVHIQWTGAFVAALAYVSIGALSLLYIMIKQRAVNRVARFFYMVPVSAAIASYILDRDGIDVPVLIGIVVIARGVHARQSQTHAVAGDVAHLRVQMSYDTERVKPRA